MENITVTNDNKQYETIIKHKFQIGDSVISKSGEVGTVSEIESHITNDKVINRYKISAFRFMYLFEEDLELYTGKPRPKLLDTFDVVIEGKPTLVYQIETDGEVYCVDKKDYLKLFGNEM